MPNIDLRAVLWCCDYILVPHTVWLHCFESGCRVWIHGLRATACTERRQLRGQDAVGIVHYAFCLFVCAAYACLDEIEARTIHYQRINMWV